jgi:hypothetical protein
MSRLHCLLLALICGCGRAGPEIVPVKGTITLNGGPWPQAGTLYLTPFEAAQGQPETPGYAAFDKEGKFVADCTLGNGLVPGKYRVGVESWQLSPDETRPEKPEGVSLVPDKYRSPATSGLEFEVASGSDGVELSFDVKK